MVIQKLRRARERPDRYTDYGHSFGAVAVRIGRTPSEVSEGKQLEAGAAWFLKVTMRGYVYL